MSKKSFYDFDDDRDIFSDSSKQSRKNTPQKKTKQNVQSNNRNFPSGKSNNNSRPTKNNMKNNNKNSKRKTTNIPIDKRQNAKKKKKSSFMGTFCKVFFSVMLICILLLTGAYAYISNMFGGIKYKNNDKQENKYIDESKLINKSGVLNILLVGGDDPQGGKTFRSDTMMLMTIDTHNDKIKLSSFLRDSYVEIPGKNRKNKLNSACSSGGIQLVQDTIEYNFHVKIDNYVYVDFNAFEKIIDVLGGVDVPVTKREANYMNRNYRTWVTGVSSFHVNSGESVHLNGKEALLFSRIRKLDSDFKRTERQRMVMSAIKGKVSDVSLTTLLDLVKEVSPYIQTDFSKNELMSLSYKAGTKYLKYDIVQKSVPETDEWYSKYINGQAMVMFKDLEKTRNDLQEFLYNE